MNESLGAVMTTSSTQHPRAELAAELARISNLVVKPRITAASCTTFAIGGPFEYLIEPNSDIALCAAVKVLQRHSEPVRILGAGSNLLVDDSGLGGITLRLGRAFRFTSAKQDTRFDVGAGMSLMSLSRDLSEAGFSGLEFAGGIPASFGGAVRMNAGAHGSEISAVVSAVKIVTALGEIELLSPRDLEFSYRHSTLPDQACIIGAEIKLVAGDRAHIVQRRQEYLAERKRRQPLASPSAGSVFRNPAGDRSAGALLEQAGMKGATVGGARVSLLHANWIINDKRQATAADVRTLIAQCQSKAKQQFDVELVPELVIWGND